MARKQTRRIHVKKGDAAAFERLAAGVDTKGRVSRKMVPINRPPEKMPKDFKAIELRSVIICLLCRHEQPRNPKLSFGRERCDVCGARSIELRHIPI